MLQIRLGYKGVYLAEALPEPFPLIACRHRCRRRRTAKTDTRPGANK